MCIRDSFKGVLASLAGPAPNYDMQRILATRNPREASLMNGMVTVVLMFPRYLMIAGITVLALAFCMPALKSQGNPDFEKILPLVLSGQVPTGVLGFLLAGLAAAFMSNFAATLNAAPVSYTHLSAGSPSTSAASTSSQLSSMSWP